MRVISVGIGIGDDILMDNVIGVAYCRGRYLECSMPAISIDALLLV